MVNAWEITAVQISADSLCRNCRQHLRQETRLQCGREPGGYRGAFGLDLIGFLKGGVSLALTTFLGMMCRLKSPPAQAVSTAVTRSNLVVRPLFLADLVTRRRRSGRLMDITFVASFKEWTIRW